MDKRKLHDLLWPPLPCDKCDEVEVRKLLVAENKLTRACSACGTRTSINLPSLRKTVVYLDQNFLSSSMRGEPRFVGARQKLEALVADEAVVCPYSSVHIDETYLWRDSRSAELLREIRELARFQAFKDESEIRRSQLRRSLTAFLEDEDPDTSVASTDALPATAHHWTRSAHVSVNRDWSEVVDFDELRNLKDRIGRSLVGTLAAWRSEFSGSQETKRQEADAIARYYWGIWKDIHTLSANVDPLGEPVDFSMVRGFARTLSKHDQPVKSSANFADFLASEHFRATPHIDIATTLWTTLRRNVHHGQLKTSPKRMRS